MTLVFKIFVILFLLSSAYLIINNIKIRNYRKNAKQGTKCFFYIGENKYLGWIVERNGDMVKIHSGGKLHLRYIYVTYPV